MIRAHENVTTATYWNGKSCPTSSSCIKMVLRTICMFWLGQINSSITEHCTGASYRCIPSAVANDFAHGLIMKRHDIEMTSTIMTSSNGNIFRVPGHLCRVTGEFPAQRPVTWSFDVFFDLGLNKRFSKQSWGWWFETPMRSLWRHCNATFMTPWKRNSTWCWALVFSLLLDWTSYITNNRIAGDLRHRDAIVASLQCHVLSLCSQYHYAMAMSVA